MHWPKFPPQLYEWLPGLPFSEPPLPYFLLHSTPQWLTFEQREELENRFGHWATRRAESTAPKGNFEVTRRIAEALYSAHPGV